MSLLALCGLSCLAAQQAPVFRTGAVRVVLDVVVTDAAGRPVMDLAADEFEVRENGRVQAIDLFDRVTVPPGTRDIRLLTRQGPVLDTVSNAPPPRTSRAFVFVIDEGSLDPLDILPVKHLMTRFLGRLSRDDVMAVTYIGRSDLGQDFTTDASRVVQSIDALGAAFGSPATTNMAAVIRQSDDRALHMVLGNVIASLSAARQPRRLVVLVSRGVIGGQGRSRLPFDAWRELFEDARRAAVPIYTLDPSGLLAPELGLQGAMEDQTPERRRGLDAARRGGHSFLRTIASNTGGRALVNRWNLDDSVDQIVADNSHYYVIGYQPQPYARDGKFHRVSVTVARRGLRVRSRAGYTADRGPQEGASAPAELRDALAAGLPGGLLPVTAFAAPIALSDRGAKIALAIDVGGPMPGAGRSDRLRITWIALDPDGRVRASGDRTADVSRPAGEATARVRLVDVWDVPADASTLRVAVVSDRASAHGTVHLPLDVPNARAGRPVLLPLILGAAADAPAVRLTSHDLPFDPVAARRFMRHDRIRVHARVLNPGPAPTPALRVLSAGGTAEILTTPLAMTRVGDRLDLLGTVDLSTLAPGAYVLELSVATAEGRTERRAVRIHVE